MTPTKKPDAEKRNAEREAALTFVRMAKEKGLSYRRESTITDFHALLQRRQVCWTL